MTLLLDGDRLLGWLESQKASLIESAKARHDADDELDAEGNVIHQDPTALRMDGGAANLFLIINSLHSFEVTEPRTPISEINLPAVSKVRRRDPQTSFEAATAQTAEKSQRLYTAIYRVLSRRSLTDDELIAALERSAPFSVTPSGVRSRRKELVQAGWVHDTGLQRPSTAGKPSTVWEAVPENV